jgi:hypothetical protein
MATLRHLLIVDEETHRPHVVSCFIFGSFANRDDALRAAKMQGLKLAAPGGQPEPPEAAATPATPR